MIWLSQASRSFSVVSETVTRAAALLASTIIRRNVVVATVIAAVAAVALRSVELLQARLTSELSVVSGLQGELSTIQELRTRGAGQDAWSQQVGRTTAYLEKQKTAIDYLASTKAPAAMHLVWASRDYFPRLLAEPVSAGSDSERRLSEHLKEAERLLQSQARPQEGDNLLVGLVVAIDLVAAGVIAYRVGGFKAAAR